MLIFCSQFIMTIYFAKLASEALSFVGTGVCLCMFLFCVYATESKQKAELSGATLV